MDYISSELTAWRVKAIYGANVSKFSDDLLKGIPLSRHVGPLLPAKYMWKTGTKEKSVQKDSNKEEESGGSIVNEQAISNEEQQEQSEEEESTEVSDVDYNSNDCEENDTEIEETAVKANTDTNGSEREHKRRVTKKIPVRLFV